MISYSTALLFVIMWLTILAILVHLIQVSKRLQKHIENQILADGQTVEHHVKKLIKTHARDDALRGREIRELTHRLGYLVCTVGDNKGQLTVTIKPLPKKTKKNRMWHKLLKNK